MPEEQSTPAASEVNVEAAKADSSSDPGQSPTIDQPAKAEAPPADLPKPTPSPPKPEQQEAPQSSGSKPDRPRTPLPKVESKSESPTSSKLGQPGQVEKPTEDPLKKPTEGPAPGATRGNQKAAQSSPPGSKDTPAGTQAKSPSKGGAKSAAKKASPAAESAQDATVGDSKIEAILTQIVGAVGKVLASILSALGHQIQKLSVYSKVEPIVKGISLLWNKGIVPFGNIVIKPIWGLGLKVLRGRFSNGLKAFSDRFLTIVILSFATLIYWLFSSLIPPSQPAVQQQPMPAPVANAPAPVPVAQPTPISPPAAEAPSVEAEAEPPPPPEPEYKPIIEVQSQVAQVFDQYSQDLIAAVQANFEEEQLVVKVSDRWFELSQAEQNQLGTDALERSRKLEFTKLEIRDQTGQLLAREPVVGSNIIVLQRRTPPPELTTDSPA